MKTQKMRKYAVPQNIHEQPIGSTKQQPDSLSDPYAGRPLTLPAGIETRIRKNYGLNPKEISFRESSDVAGIGAHAITQGNAVRFAPGEFRPHSLSGLKTLGHELSHVAEQAKGSVHANVPLTNIHFNHNNEAKSDRMGDSFAANVMPTVVSPISLRSGSAYGAPIQGLFGKKKKPKPATAPPAEIQFGKPTKGLKDGSTGSSVMMLPTKTKGEKAVVKADTNPMLEASLADFYNMGGAAYAEQTPKGKWGFDAPAARPLLDSEREDAKHKYASGALSETQATSRSLDEKADKTTVFSGVGGKSIHPGYGGKSKKFHEKPISASGKDSGQYREMLGYAGFLDQITGNTDRFLTFYNPENWMEDRDEKRVHLIDNDFYGGYTSLGDTRRTGMEDTAWQNWARQLTSTTGDEKKGGFVHELAEKMKDTLVQDASLVGSETEEGMKKALADLPKFREALEEKNAALPEESEQRKYNTLLINRIDFILQIIAEEQEAEEVETTTEAETTEAETTTPPTVAASETEQPHTWQPARVSAAATRRTTPPVHTAVSATSQPQTWQPARVGTTTTRRATPLLRRKKPGAV